MNIQNALLIVLAAVAGIVTQRYFGWTIPQVFLALAIANTLAAVWIFTIVPEFLMRFLSWVLVRTLYKLRAQGIEEHVPDEGPALIVCNHVSYMLGWLDLPPALHVAQSPWVLGVSGVLAGAEFFADKIPGVDSGWDLLHTLLRVPVGAFLAAATLSPDGSLGAGMLATGAGVALTSHVLKAGSRALLNTSPEPVSNWTASAAEDVTVVGGLALAFAHPCVHAGRRVDHAPVWRHGPGPGHLPSHRGPDGRAHRRAVRTGPRRHVPLRNPAAQGAGRHAGSSRPR